VSDINLTLSGPQLFMIYLMTGILPLTIATALCAYWLRRKRRSRVALVALIVFGVPWLGSAGGWLAVGVSYAHDTIASHFYQQSHERTLARPETIGGVAFPAGSVVHDYGTAGGPIDVDLPGPAEIDGIPATGTIDVLAGSGLTGDVTLARDAEIDGLTCDASASATFAAGQLTRCRLKRAARIAGVPCIGDFDRSDGVQCTLASAYRTNGIQFAAGTEWIQSATFALATIEANPPDLRVLGHALARGTDVRLEGNAVDVATPTKAGACAVDHLRFEAGKVSGTGYGCQVRLPASVFAFAHGAPR
jgi:hypothetical protein